MYLWTLALVAAGICIAVLAAALAPSPGNHYQPIGALLGLAGLFSSIWVGWYAHAVPWSNVPLDEARAALRDRERARSIVAKNPTLADELKIGRPDLAREFNDGGLVDVNHVPLSVLSALPGVTVEIADKIVTFRSDVGGFDSCADMEVVLQLSPYQLDQTRDRLLFRKI